MVGSRSPAVQAEAAYAVPLTVLTGHASASWQIPQSVPVQPSQHAPQLGSCAASPLSRANSSWSGRSQTHVAQLSTWKSVFFGGEP